MSILPLRDDIQSQSLIHNLRWYKSMGSLRWIISHHNRDTFLEIAVPSSPRSDRVHTYLPDVLFSRRVHAFWVFSQRDCLRHPFLLLRFPDPVWRSTTYGDSSGSPFRQSVIPFSAPLRQRTRIGLYIDCLLRWKSKELCRFSLFLSTIVFSDGDPDK